MPYRSFSAAPLRTIIRSAAVVAGLFALPFIPLAAAATNFNGDFESGSYRPFDGVQHEEDRPMADSFAMVSDPVRQGHYAARITVKQGYSRWGYNEDTELLWDSNEHEGDDYYYSWSTLFPTDWVAPSRWGIFLQWHASLGTSPPLSFDARGDNAYVHVRAGNTDEARNEFAYDKQIEVLHTLSKGKWNDFVVHVHWSASNGTVEVWNRVAGDSQFTKTASLSGVPTLQRTDKGTASNYTLWGLYRGSYCPQPTQLGCTSSQGTQADNTLYEDGFTRGTSFDDVVQALGGGSPSGGSPAPAPAPAPALSPSPAPASSSPATSSTGSQGPDLPLVSDVGVVTDSGCSGCRVDVSGSVINARIAGGADNVDTAYALEDFGGSNGWNSRFYARDMIGLGTQQKLTANLAVLQALDTNKAILYELFVAPDRTLHLWSAPGRLRSEAINVGTGVTVPNDGSSIGVEVSALANDSVTVRVNGVERVVVAGLSGGTNAKPRYLVAGIDHYDSGSSNEPVAVTHRDVGVTTTGWLGERTVAAVTAGGSSSAGGTVTASAGGSGSVGGGSTGSSGGSNAAHPSTSAPAATSSSEAGGTFANPTASVVWDNVTFKSAGPLVQYLARRGVAWNTFLDNHRQVATALGLKPVEWEDAHFFTTSALAGWLRVRGVGYHRWAASHPAAAQILAQGTAVSGMAERSSVLTWNGKRFSTGAALREYVQRRGSTWETFLRTHVASARTLGVRPVQWSGQRFYTASALAKWLGAHGQSYERWARIHPRALSGTWQDRPLRTTAGHR